MNRRSFLATGARLTIVGALPSEAMRSDVAEPVLTGTAPLSESGDLATQMVDGINEYVLHTTAESISNRAALWKRNYDSVENYQASMAENREHLKKIIGA